MNVWERKKRNSSRKIIENIGAVLVEHKEALDAPEQEYWRKKAAFRHCECQNERKENNINIGYGIFLHAGGNFPFWKPVHTHWKKPYTGPF